MGYIIIILFTLFFAYMVDKKHPTKNEKPRFSIRPVEQSIEAAWRATDQTTVPADMLVAYRRYLKSEPWFKLRKLALKRDGHRCVRCSYVGDLQVHHTSYSGIYESFNFSVDQLVSLCDICHNEEHKSLREGKGSTL